MAQAELHFYSDVDELVRAMERRLDDPAPVPQPGEQKTERVSSMLSWQTFAQYAVCVAVFYAILLYIG